jgi:LmbE family N-acetylglucosaminyl deacetylase
MRTLYISPHLDDAVLSAGGLIHDQVRLGQRVEIWTMMCGFPEPQELSQAAVELHAKWGTTTIPETVTIRRAEDTRAAAMLGAKPVHFDFPDAIYRRGRDGAPLYDELLATPVHPADRDLPLAIARALKSRLRADDTVTCQLAVGEHVDHLLVRQAAELLGRPLLYAVDIPYVLNHPDDLAPKTEGLQSRLESVSESGLEAWLQAAAAYASQLTSLYESWDALQRDIRLTWAREHGIRLWYRPTIL